MMSTNPTCNRSRLRDAQILFVADANSQALCFASELALAGAAITLARSIEHAYRALETQSFAAVILAGNESSASTCARLVHDLRCGDRPVFAVVFASAAEHGLIRECVAAGVLEFVGNEAGGDERLDAVVACVRATARLRANLPLALAACGANANRPRHTPPAEPKVVSPPLGGFAGRYELSQRERAVLCYLAKGYRYRDIGVALDITARTVKMHVANVRRKAGVTNRHDLVRLLDTEAA